MPLPPLSLSGRSLLGKTGAHPKLLKLISLWWDHLGGFLVTVVILG
jgi:hypothetical protein